MPFTDNKNDIYHKTCKKICINGKKYFGKCKITVKYREPKRDLESIKRL